MTRSNNPNNTRNRLFTGVFAASLALAGSANAQMLEEVVVTAQKRVESLQDVPISITAVSGEKMTEAGVFKIEDLQTFTPNLTMTESGISTQIYIRGIGTGNNQGFEQSVGTYVDGVYYGRQQLLRLPFLDLERVEVLRGPQSILFGKNSIAGALNMTTAKPSDEFEGRIGGVYSPDGDIGEVSGFVSGGITENLSGRLVGRWYEEDGYVENRTLSRDEPKREEWGLRGILSWDATDNLNISFKAEYHEFDVEGRQIEIVQDDPAREGAGFAGSNFSEILGILGHPEGIVEARQDNKRDQDGGDNSYNEVYNYTMNIDWAIGDMTLTAITGAIGYDFTEVCDCDFTGAPVFYGEFEENYEQFSQEIRLVSPGGETVDWIAGVFYQSSELDYTDTTIVPDGSVLGNPIIRGGILAALYDTGSNRVYESDSDLYAVFAQGTWNINDSWRLTLGGRYTQEDKDGFKEINTVDINGNIINDPFVATLYLAVFQTETQQSTGHLNEESLDEGVFTPLINVQWDVNNDVMLYASASEGYKSGGFDARSNTQANFSFDEETATTYEIGGKTAFADGAAELNFALYYTEYEDLQVSQFDGVVGFTVGNAAETVVQGLELDGRWMMTDNLLMSYASAYLDHEFKDFTNGNCYNRQEAPLGDVVDGVQLCDYTGMRGQYTPKWTHTISLDHTWTIGNGSMDFRSGIDVNYVGKQNTHVNLDPQYEVDDITKVNLRFGLYANNWDVAVLGQNITDEQQLTYVGNAPLSGTSFDTNTFYSFASRPRTVYLQANYHF